MKKALEKLGFRFTEAKEGESLKTQGHYSVHEEVDIRIEGHGKVKYDGAVGFKKQEDGTYTAVGDFYGLRTEDGRSVSATIMRNEVTAHAKKSEINDRLLRMEFTAGQEKEDSKYLELTYERWVQ